ncbi:endonuclease III domain-containing protein [Candidatus Woesearchaeota archaeon]|nr:endonuclease III domain-containing protein [Candidatus Woesearchaeota archaeon]
MNKPVQIYKLLLERFGRQNWWPVTAVKAGKSSKESKGSKEFEVMIGAILTQNTAWRNAEKAIAGLAKMQLLSPERIRAADTKELATAIRPVGYYNQKAERLKILARHIVGNYNGKGGISAMKRKSTEELRSELLELKGIGPETADSMLLYALDKPVFVVDTYTRRTFSRIGLCSSDSSYEELQKLFMESLPQKKELFNDYHALIVEHGKSICRKEPLCGICPLLNICRYGRKNSAAKRGTAKGRSGLENI